MAFLDSRNKDRFSLLLLEPGEIYFEDFSAHIHRKEDNETASKWNLKGRLKICSKSVVFDPEDFSYPVLKFPLRECEVIEKWSGPLLSKLGNNLVHIKCRQVVHMLEGNVIEPYKFKKETNSFLFSLTYVKIDACLPQMCQLQRAATLPAADQAAMIAAIVLSRQSRVSFNTSWLEDLHETIVLETMGNRVTPLVLNPGRILLTNSRLYFQPFNNAEPDNITWPVMKIKLCDIKRIVRRRFLLRQVGLEFYCNDSAPLKHLFLSFKSSKERNQLFMCMQDQSALKLEDTKQENMTLLWQNGQISNYEYLLYINSLADRSFNDLTQYPVFPWVIADYNSTELDLTNTSSYRDLTKPIGALNEERLQKLQERYKDMAEPKFLYGSHYSTPGFVLYYLVRQMPQYMLCLQYGRFDHPDRMFNSIQDTWRNVTHNSSDFKELIPQFYEPENQGSFLVNSQNLNFGIRHNGQKVNDVELPPWAENSPAKFVSLLRDALESEYVSNNLHHWIDLIFGYKQRGLQAENAYNVFYHLTYEGAVDLDNIRDLNERYSMEVQIMEFGQIPKQIFKYGHPVRQLPSVMKELALNSYQSEGANNKAIITGGGTISDRLDGNNGCGQEPHRRQSKTVAFKWKQNLSELNFHSEYKLHKCEVTAVCVSDDLKTVFSVSQDTLLKMYSVEEKKQLRSVSISNLALSSCVLMEDGCKIIVGSWDNYVYIYNIEFGKVLGSTMAHDDAVVDISWNQGLLATASWDSTAKVWKYNPNDSLRHYHTGELLVELEHETGVQCVALNGSNSLLATGTNDGCINFWRMDSFILQLNVKNHVDVVEAISFSPDEQKVVSCSKDGTLKVLDVATGTLLFSKDAGEALICLCWDGITVLTGGAKGNLMVFDLIRACQICSIPAQKGPITCLDVSKGGELIVSGGKDGRVAIWEPAMQL